MTGIVLLHGFTGSSRSWDRVVDDLPRDLEIHRPELRGHGPTSADLDGSFEDEVDRLAAQLDTHAPGSVHLVGYSMGGRLAFGLLARHPQRFRAATLIGAHPGLEGPEERRQRLASDAALADDLERRGVERFVDRWQEHPLFESQKRLPAEVLADQRAQRLRHRATGLALALRTLGPGSMPSYWPTLPTMELPIQLLVGGDDDKFLRIAQRMAGELPNARVERVPRVGHNPILEAPAAVARTIRRALSAPLEDLP